MSVSMITTVRVTGEARAANLAYVLAWYQRHFDWEWIVVEQDSAPRLADTGPIAGLKRLFVVNPGPFNKPWGYNVGVRAARGDVLYFCDADLLVPKTALETAESLCTRRVQAVNPYDTLVDLGEERTRRLLGGEEAPDFAGEGSPTRHGGSEHICFCGGAFFMRRALHHHMGGFDERFLGWGGEDDAMTLRLRRTTNEVTEIRGRCALHLWHERTPVDTDRGLGYRMNLALLERLKTLAEPEFRFMRDVQRQIMGHPGKYEARPAAERTGFRE